MRPNGLSFTCVTLTKPFRQEEAPSKAWLFEGAKSQNELARATSSANLR
jgi:hypothetical protein